MRGKIVNFQQKRHALKVNMSLHKIFKNASDPSIVSEPPVALVSEQFEIYEETS